MNWTLSFAQPIYYCSALFTRQQRKPHRRGHFPHPIGARTVQARPDGCRPRWPKRSDKQGGCSPWMQRTSECNQYLRVFALSASTLGPFGAGLKKKQLRQTSRLHKPELETYSVEPSSHPSTLSIHHNLTPISTQSTPFKPSNASRRIGHIHSAHSDRPHPLGHPSDEPTQIGPTPLH